MDIPRKTLTGSTDPLPTSSGAPIQQTISQPNLNQHEWTLTEKRRAISDTRLKKSKPGLPALEDRKVFTSPTTKNKAWYSKTNNELSHLTVADSNGNQKSILLNRQIFTSQKLQTTSYYLASPNKEFYLPIFEGIHKHQAWLSKHCTDLSLEYIFSLGQESPKIIHRNTVYQAASMIDNNIGEIYIKGKSIQWAYEHNNTPVDKKQSSSSTKGIVAYLDDNGNLHHYVCTKMEGTKRELLLINPSDNKDLKINAYAILSWQQELNTYLAIARHTTLIQGAIEITNEEFFTWTKRSVSHWKYNAEQKAYQRLKQKILTNDEQSDFAIASVEIDVQNPMQSIVKNGKGDPFKLETLMA